MTNTTNARYTWKKATPRQMIDHLKMELSLTPRRRVFKRMRIKGDIKSWEKQS